MLDFQKIEYLMQHATANTIIKVTIKKKNRHL